LHRLQLGRRDGAALARVCGALHLFLLDRASGDANAGNQAPRLDGQYEPNAVAIGFHGRAQVGVASSVAQLVERAPHQIGRQELADSRVLEIGTSGPAPALRDHLDAGDRAPDEGR
jgi:hypothetical protein